MNKKIIATLSIITLSVIIFSISSNSALDESIISQTIFVDTVYEPENNLVKITYNDNSKKTNLVTLEILGMEETFHKEFSQQSFVEIVQFYSAPKYGWASMPVVFSINHEGLGKIELKTEIHPYDEPKPKVIYSIISHSEQRNTYTDFMEDRETEKNKP